MIRAKSALAVLGVAAAMSATPAMAENWAHSAFGGLNLGLYGGIYNPCECFVGGASVGYGAGAYSGIFGSNTNLYVGGELQVGFVDMEWVELAGFSKLGVEFDNRFLLYKTLGVGSVDSSPFFAAGAGLGVKVTDNISFDTQVVGLNFGSSFSEVRVTAGFKWYLDDTQPNGETLGRPYNPAFPVL